MEKKKLESQMQDIQQQIILGGRSPELESQETKIQQQLHNMLRREEVFWKDKSRVHWLKEGEKNTKFFHRSIIQHKSHNKITHLVTR